jgi:anti-anti-sigma regulatory factor
LVIDLSGVTYLNNATVKPLFDLSERLRTRRQQLRLVRTGTAPMRKLFQVLKFDLVVPLHVSFEEALQTHANSKPRG